MKKTLRYFTLLLLTWIVTNVFVASSLKSQTVQFGKSYVNISKPNGGTFEAGDVLEIRATIALSAGTVTRLRYNDTIPANCTYIAGSLKTITNEGFAYFSYTDAADLDSGNVNGTRLRVNMGTTAGACNEATQGNAITNAGTLVNNMRPSFYLGTCIRVIAYRVTINPALPLGTVITINAGNFRYNNAVGTAVVSNFSTNTLMLSQNLSLCSNSVGANALVSETNGTFGSGKPKNRGTSPLVPLPYTFRNFTSNTPNDNFYGIANNTSGVYTTNPSLPYPNANRVFQVWDIIGDHTGAANPLLGNPPADTVNSTGGYALIINASYQPNRAFTQTITNLCPNTYYEFSAWFRNICRRCRCDSTGRGAGQAGFIPGAGNDSSGVRPNLTFQIDGIDYFTTGNMPYTGNWVQKGYTLRTGAGQNSFTITIRNNAPGGGGNDWAIDDIRVATCNPVQVLNPPSQYVGCDGAANVTFIDTVRTFFPNYKFIRWEKSCDNGVNWNTVKNDTIVFTAKIGNDSVGRSLYNFTPVYADSNCLIRVKAGTTFNNLSDANCSVVSSGATRLVISQCTALKIVLSNVDGKLNNGTASLWWDTDTKIENGVFIIEKSLDGSNFYEAGRVMAYANKPGTQYSYGFEDDETVNDAAYYRIKASTADGRAYKYSETVLLRTRSNTFALISLTNPVREVLKLKLVSHKTGTATIELVSLYGRILNSTLKQIHKGVNPIELNRFPATVTGNYFLRISFDGTVINKPIIKL
jgi:hypothetical protein